MNKTENTENKAENKAELIETPQLNKLYKDETGRAYRYVLSNRRRTDKNGVQTMKTYYVRRYLSDRNKKRGPKVKQNKRKFLELIRYYGENDFIDLIKYCENKYLNKEELKEIANLLNGMNLEEHRKDKEHTANTANTTIDNTNDIDDIEEADNIYNELMGADE